MTNSPTAVQELLAAIKAAKPRRELRHRISMLVNDWERILAALARVEEDSGDA
jgi:hypothetical protein